MVQCSCPLTFFSTGAPVPFGTNHCPLSTPASSPPTLLSPVFEENESACRSSLSFFFFSNPSVLQSNFHSFFRFVTLISPSFWQEVYTCQHIHFQSENLRCLVGRPSLRVSQPTTVAPSKRSSRYRTSFTQTYPRLLSAHRQILSNLELYL